MFVICTAEGRGVGRESIFGYSRCRQLLKEDNISVSVIEIAMNNERRRSGRLYEPYPTRVRGMAKSGESFAFETVVDNISYGGLYLKMPLDVAPEQALRCVVSFKTSATDERGAARLWLKGKVLRSEPQPDGRYGIALAVMNYRFL